MGGGYKGMEAWNDNLIVLCSSFYSYELPSAFILVCTTVTTLLQSRLIRKVQWDVNIDCIVFHYGDVSKIKFPNHIDIIDNKKKPGHRQSALSRIIRVSIEYQFIF